ncbi:DUF2938 domain-containing protein [Bowmanella denitrificans]|uniref:DUF2938 domain-containing protein n=1 Tax=Bowmanella denitrificans TaxID=366582 RepID=UPI000C9D03BF|nr:DUF2938 domain-containing protein [Bowmanella denitrificans]
MQYIVDVLLIGIGATLVMDLWALLLKRGFNVASLNFCMVGRWLCHIPDGQFYHQGIARSAPKSGECAVGWTAHYVIGVAFALVLTGVPDWLNAPTLLPALVFGAITVLIPYLVMQPALGMGIAAAKTPNPMLARVKSLITHLVFGAGLYLSALIVRAVF